MNYSFLIEFDTNSFLRKTVKCVYNGRNQFYDKMIDHFIDELVETKSLREAIELYNLKCNGYIIRKLHSDKLHDIYNILCTYDENDFREKLLHYKEIMN